jgi:hypothetical protein
MTGMSPLRLMAGTSHLLLMGHPLLGKLIVGTSLLREIDGWDVPFTIDGTSPLGEIDSWDIPS